MSEAREIHDLLRLAHELFGEYENRIIASVNDHVVRISRLTGPYFWHFHPESDETFLTVEGDLLLELEDRLIELAAGQMFTVPKGVIHRTSPRGAVSINLTFELACLTTVQVDGPLGNAGSQ